NVLGELNGTAMDLISQMRPVKYEWNDLHKQLYGTSTDTVMYGFVAQELMSVIPEMVKQGGDGYYWYNPSGFEAVLTAGMQELGMKIASLSEQFRITDSSGSAGFSEIRDMGTLQGSDMGNSVFQSVISVFSNFFEIVFEKGLLRVASVITNKLSAVEVETKKLCVGETCVTEPELKKLLEKNNITPTPTPRETPQEVILETPAPEQTPEPTATPEIAPEGTPAAPETPSEIPPESEQEIIPETPETSIPPEQTPEPTATPEIAPAPVSAPTEIPTEVVPTE
ncbi:MAG: tail fiber domain-containing protein, partial [Patescibacteria group bacterium]